MAVLAGCGGGGARLSKPQFEQHLKRDAVLAAKALTNASTAAGKGNAAYVGRITLAQADLQKAADDLDGIRPPKDAAAATDTVVSTLRFFRVQLGKLRHAVQTQNGSEAAAVSKAIGSSRELKDFDAAIRDLQRKGYDVGVFGR